MVFELFDQFQDLADELIGKNNKIMQLQEALQKKSSTGCNCLKHAEPQANNASLSNAIALSPYMVKAIYTYFRY